MFDDDVDGQGANKLNRGTKKSKEFYRKTVPVELSTEIWNTDSSSFLYEIVTRLESEAALVKNEHHRHQDHLEKVGLIVGQEIAPHKLPSTIDLYTLSGKVSARLVPRGKVWFTNAQWSMVKKFQHLAFKDVLACKDDWAEEDFSGDNGSAVIVPLKNGLIDETVFQQSGEIGRNTVIIPKQKPNKHFFVEEVICSPTLMQQKLNHLPCLSEGNVNGSVTP